MVQIVGPVEPTNKYTKEYLGFLAQVSNWDRKDLFTSMQILSFKKKANVTMFRPKIPDFYLCALFILFCT